MVLKNRGILGLDLGTRNIKIVKNDRAGYIDSWVIEAIPPGLMRHGSIISEKAFGRHIKMVLEKNGIKGKECALCLPANDIISKLTTLPRMENKMIIENLRYELGDYLAKSIDDYIVDYKVIDMNIKNKVEYWDIMAVAVDKRTLDTRLEILSEAGLKPKYVDTPINCLQKFLIAFGTLKYRQIMGEKAVCLVDIGESALKIMIFNRGKYLVDRVIPLTYDAHSSNKGHWVEIRQAIEDIIIFFGNQHYRDRGIENILLIGGGALESGLLDYLKGFITPKIEYFSQYIDIKGIPKSWDQSHISLLGNAIGATIRGMPS